VSNEHAGQEVVTVNASLNHAAARESFPALIDQELEPATEAQVRTHLVACDSCRQGFERYERAVEKVRALGRENAPDALATLILNRTRKRRGLRNLVRVHNTYRLPVEIILPVLLAAVIAALMMLLLT